MHNHSEIDAVQFSKVDSNNLPEIIDKIKH